MHMTAMKHVSERVITRDVFSSFLAFLFYTTVTSTKSSCTNRRSSFPSINNFINYIIITFKQYIHRENRTIHCAKTIQFHCTIYN